MNPLRVLDEEGEKALEENSRRESAGLADVPVIPVPRPEADYRGKS